MELLIKVNIKVKFQILMKKKFLGYVYDYMQNYIIMLL